MIYQGGSFFTLDPIERAGLLLLSSLVAVMLVAATSHLRRRTNSSCAGLIAALVLFWLFVWLSPQLYYTYYRMIIPGLPLQWVIKQPPTPLRLWELFTFSHATTLAAHSAGLLGWLLIGAGIFRPGRLCRPLKED